MRAKRKSEWLSAHVEKARDEGLSGVESRFHYKKIITQSLCGVFSEYGPSLR